MQLSPAAQQVLDKFHQRIEQEHELQEALETGQLVGRRDEFLLPVGETVGRFLHTLALTRRARCIVEVGTSYGYSTLFLADAARLTGGKVITLENVDYKQESAKRSLAEAGLEQYVDWRLGDALELLQEIAEPVDLVLLDLWKDLYVPCLEILYPKLAHGGLIAADNMLHPEGVRAEAEAYQAQVRALPDIVDSELLDLGSGIELSCCWRP